MQFLAARTLCALSSCGGPPGPAQPPAMRPTWSVLSPDTVRAHRGPARRPPSASGAGWPAPPGRCWGPAPRRPGPGEEVGHAGVGEQPAPADDDQVLGGQGHLVHQVGGDEHRPAVGGQVAQQGPDPADALGVEAVERLVEDDRGRVAEQGGGDAQALAHAEREATGPPAPHLAQAHQLDHRIHPGAGRGQPRGGGHAGQGVPGIQGGGGVQVASSASQRVSGSANLRVLEDTVKRDARVSMLRLGPTIAGAIVREGHLDPSQVAHPAVLLVRTDECPLGISRGRTRGTATRPPNRSPDPDLSRCRWLGARLSQEPRSRPCRRIRDSRRRPPSA
jgi:hypothetical protein